MVGLATCLDVRATQAEVVVVVSPLNPVTTLSMFKVVYIFLGWANLFPDGSQIVLIDQIEGSTARNEFYAIIADMSAAQLKAYWSKIIFTVKKYLSDNPNATGYLERDLVDNSVKVLVVQ